MMVVSTLGEVRWLLQEARKEGECECMDTSMEQKEAHEHREIQKEHEETDHCRIQGWPSRRPIRSRIQGWNRRRGISARIQAWNRMNLISAGIQAGRACGKINGGNQWRLICAVI